MNPILLSLVEDEWPAARRRALELRGSGVDVVHLIRGRVEPEVVALIQPPAYARLVSVPRRWFRWRMWPMLAAYTLGGRLRWVLADRERTRRALSLWCRLFHLTLKGTEVDPSPGA